jgi:pimeloyl-ACP methyl ester carboxylesterase
MEAVMKRKLEKYNIEYNVEGEGQDLVILHGWGCNKEMFDFLVDHYKSKYRVFAFDLPGFGGSDEPTQVMGTMEYAKRMHEVFDALEIKNPIGIGHSFGGRILIKMAMFYTFDKLILTGSAGVVNKRPLRYYIKVYTFKVMKRLYRMGPVQKVFPNMLEKYRKKSGSADYNQASPIMKQVLSKVVNENLVHEFNKIKVPTLLIWGELDTATPLSDGKLMEKEFQDAGLVVFEGGSHYAFLEQAQRFLKVLDAFI